MQHSLWNMHGINSHAMDTPNVFTLSQILARTSKLSTQAVSTLHSAPSHVLRSRIISSSAKSSAHHLLQQSIHTPPPPTITMPTSHLPSSSKHVASSWKDTSWTYTQHHHFTRTSCPPPISHVRPGASSTGICGVFFGTRARYREIAGRLQMCPQRMAIRLDRHQMLQYSATKVTRPGCPHCGDDYKKVTHMFTCPSLEAASYGAHTRSRSHMHVQTPRHKPTKAGK
jgi:hypothetical protein